MSITQPKTSLRFTSFLVVSLFALSIILTSLTFSGPLTSAYSQGNAVPSSNQNLQSASTLPQLRSSSSNFAAPASSVTCSLNGVVAGDTLFAVVQSSGVAQTTMIASDSFGDSFSYQAN